MKLIAGRTQDLADIEAIVESGADRELLRTCVARCPIGPTRWSGRSPTSIAGAERIAIGESRGRPKPGSSAAAMLKRERKPARRIRGLLHEVGVPKFGPELLKNRSATP